MIAITSGSKVDWSRFLFKVMKDMIQKKSNVFDVKISKMLKNADFLVTSKKDGSFVTMADADNVLTLRPKPTVGELVAVKKEVGEQQQEAKTQKQPKGNWSI